MLVPKKSAQNSDINDYVQDHVCDRHHGHHFNVGDHHGQHSHVRDHHENSVNNHAHNIQRNEPNQNPILQKQGTIEFHNSEEAEVLSHILGMYQNIRVLHIFHWIFMITLPAIGGIWSSRKDGYPLLVHAVFAMYCASLFVLEIAMLNSTPGFWEWAQSRIHVTKRISINGCWGLLLAIDLITATFSRLDLYIDVTFLWLAPQYDGLYFVPSIICLVVGVGLQMCTSLWFSYEEPNPYEETPAGVLQEIPELLADFTDRSDYYVYIHSNFRELDFALSLRFLKSTEEYNSPQCYPPIPCLCPLPHIR